MKFGKLLLALTVIAVCAFAAHADSLQATGTATYVLNGPSETVSVSFDLNTVNGAITDLAFTQSGPLDQFTLTTISSLPGEAPFLVWQNDQGAEIDFDLGTSSTITGIMFPTLGAYPDSLDFFCNFSTTGFCELNAEYVGVVNLTDPPPMSTAEPSALLMLACGVITVLAATRKRNTLFAS
jgi:hypothetical protein